MQMIERGKDLPRGASDARRWKRAALERFTKTVAVPVKGEANVCIVKKRLTQIDNLRTNLARLTQTLIHLDLVHGLARIAPALHLERDAFPHAA